MSCGSIGVDDEGQLISCSQCGQTYHPYCVGFTKMVCLFSFLSLLISELTSLRSLELFSIKVGAVSIVLFANAVVKRQTKANFFFVMIVIFHIILIVSHHHSTKYQKEIGNVNGIHRIHIN